MGQVRAPWPNVRAGDRTRRAHGSHRRDRAGESSIRYVSPSHRISARRLSCARLSSFARGATMYQAAGFAQPTITAWKLSIDFKDWIARIGTPADRSPHWIPCFPNCQARLVNIFRSVQRDLLSPTRLGLRVDDGLVPTYRGAGSNRRLRTGPIQHLAGLFPPPGILQNNAASMMIDDPPFFDLLQRAEAPETSIVIVEAAVSHARRLSGAVGITHFRRAPWREFRI